MSARAPTLLPSLPLLAALLVAGPARADVAPSEAFFAPAPAPAERDDQSALGPLIRAAMADLEGDESIALVSFTATLDLYPTTAIVRASALFEGPGGDRRRLGIPVATPWVRAAPIADLEVLVDGAQVATELVRRGASESRPETWWVWPIEAPGDAPRKVELRFAQALSTPESDADTLRLYAFIHIGDALRWRGPIRDLSYTLRLHGIPRERVTTPTPPTSEAKDELVWTLREPAADPLALGVLAEVPRSGLPDRDVLRAPYLPEDAPEHLVLHDYTTRFVQRCEPPTPAELGRLVDHLHDVAGGSTDPLARAWARRSLADLRSWCDDEEEPPVEEGEAAPPPSPVAPATARCLAWVGADEGAEDEGAGARPLASPPPCWETSVELAATMREAAARPTWRRAIALAGAALGLALVGGVLGWRRRARARARRSAAS